MAINAKIPLEMSTPELTNFAEKYIAFIKSSPCSTDYPKNRYFKAPTENEANQNDILYGADRKKAYEALMRQFRRCQRKNELEALFNEQRKLYYNPKELPGFVILKEWLEEDVPKNGFHISLSGNIPYDEYDKVIMITKHAENKHYLPENVEILDLFIPNEKAEKYEQRIKSKDLTNINDIASAKKKFEKAYSNQIKNNNDMMLKINEIGEYAKNNAVLYACGYGSIAYHAIFLHSLINEKIWLDSQENKYDEDPN